MTRGAPFLAVAWLAVGCAGTGSHPAATVPAKRAAAGQQAASVVAKRAAASHGTARMAASDVAARAASDVTAKRAAASRVAAKRAALSSVRGPSPRPATRFSFRALALSPARRLLLRGASWHPGCPVGLGRLRYLRIAHWGFDRRTHLGEMVVNASAVAAVRKAFARLFAAHFPIRRMLLVDRYGGSDYDSIQADNTSAFNCRNATGSSSWSQHAYGLAIDVNPIENPYVYGGGTTAHRASQPYLDRSIIRPGMAVPGGTLVRAFTAVGWGWGGRWPLPTDFQHFSANGR